MNVNKVSLGWQTYPIWVFLNGSKNSRCGCNVWRIHQGSRDSVWNYYVVVFMLLILCCKEWSSRLKSIARSLAWSTSMFGDILHRNIWCHTSQWVGFHLMKLHQGCSIPIWRLWSNVPLPGFLSLYFSWKLEKSVKCCTQGLCTLILPATESCLQRSTATINCKILCLYLCNTMVCCFTVTISNLSRSRSALYFRPRLLVMVRTTQSYKSRVGSDL